MKGSHVAAFLIGALAGSVVALLYAPQSGDKTRRQIRDFVDDEVDQARDFVDRTTEKAKYAVNHSVEQVKGRVAQARDFVRKEAAEVRSELCDCDTNRE